MSCSVVAFSFGGADEETADRRIDRVILFEQAKSCVAGGLHVEGKHRTSTGGKQPYDGLVGKERKSDLLLGTIDS